MSKHFYTALLFIRNKMCILIIIFTITTSHAVWYMIKNIYMHEEGCHPLFMRCNPLFLKMWIWIWKIYSWRETHILSRHEREYNMHSGPILCNKLSKLLAHLEIIPLFKVCVEIKFPCYRHHILQCTNVNFKCTLRSRNVLEGLWLRS